MARISYVNGQYVHHQEAMVHIEDRGYQFSDGIYEYIAFYCRRLLDGDLHLARMERSLKELVLTPPMTIAALRIVMDELIERNGREHGGLYLQITRGVARRDHPFPNNVRPALTMTICAPKFPKLQEITEGVKVITHPDQRWERRDIKSISLLANILAKQEASAHKRREAWLLEGDTVSEGAVSNAYIVTRSGELVTHPANTHILGGITRDVVLRLAASVGIKVVEHPFTLADVKKAAEAFITSTSINVLPVVAVDDIVIGKGVPGPITQKLRVLYEDHIFGKTGFRRT